MQVQLHSIRLNRYYIKWLSIFFLVITLLSLMALACTPPISRDALIHHLQIPKLYLQHGGMYEIPDLIFSYYPMNLDLLYMWALYIGNDILPKYIHMAFGLATALLLYHYLKERLSTTYAYLGALVFLSTPIIVRLSTTIYVDLGLVFFSTASLLLLFKWIEQNFQNKHLIIAAFCCGLAMGTKYNGLLVLFLLTFFIPILYIRSADQTRGSTRSALQSGILFFFCALIFASPWFLRNYLWTGNPIYPLYNRLFNPSAAAENATGASAIRGVFATRYVLYGENIWQLLLLPIRIFFEGIDDDPRYFDGRLNPFLLLLPLFAFWRRSTHNEQIQLEKITLLAFSIFYFLFAFNTGVLRIRYLTPIIPFLVILTMYGLHSIEKITENYISNRNKVILILLVPISIMLTLNGMYIYQQFTIIDPISYISGRLTKEDYLIKYRPEYEVMQYANNHLPDSAKILCIFMGWRGYYLNRDHLFDSNSDKKWIFSWLQEPNITVNEMIQYLHKNEISHFLIRKDLFTSWLQHATPPQRIVWITLERSFLTPLCSNPNYVLYQVNFL